MRLLGITEVIVELFKTISLSSIRAPNLTLILTKRAHARNKWTKDLWTMCMFH